jgi:hypothetical protein
MPIAILDPQEKENSKPIRSLKDNVRILYRDFGDIRDSAVLVGDLIDVGLLGVDDNNFLYGKKLPETTAFSEEEDLSGVSQMVTKRVGFDGAGKAVATYVTQLEIPDGAYVLYAWYEVTAVFTSATNDATIGIGIDTDDVTGIAPATALSAHEWDAGLHAGTPNWAMNKFTEKTTDDRAVIITVGVQDLILGAMNIYVTYMESD